MGDELPYTWLQRMSHHVHTCSRLANARNTTKSLPRRMGRERSYPQSSQSGKYRTEFTLSRLQSRTSFLGTILFPWPQPHKIKRQILL